MKTTTALLVMTLAARARAHADHSKGTEVRAAWWSSEAPIPVQLSDMSATTVGDVVYLIGGCDQDQIACDWWDGCSYCPSVSAGVWAYTPATDMWAGRTVVQDAPRARYRHAATAVSDRYIYVLGGRDAYDGLIAAVDVLDTTTGTWSTLANDWAVPRSDLAAFFSDPYVYAVGGYTELSYVAQNTSGVYDVDAGAWVSADANWAVAPMLESRGDFGVVAGDDGLFYAIGGWSHLDWCNPLQTVEAYDPAANTWTAVSSLLVGRGDKAVGTLHGRIFAIGGEHNNGCASGSTPVHDVEVYDPTASSPAWAVESYIPEAKFRFASATVGEAIYLFGGQSNVSYAGCTAADDAATPAFCYPVTDHVWAFSEARGGGGKNGGGPAPLVIVLIVVAVVLVLGGGAAVVLLGKGKPAGGAKAADASVEGEKKNPAADDTIELRSLDADSSGGGGSDALATTDESDTAPCVA